MGYESADVLVTGGSKGIGLSIAKIFARNTNRRIILIARSEADLQSAKKICIDEGAKEVLTFSLDLTDEKAVSNLDFTSLNLGIVINNAGVYLHKKLTETTNEEFHQQYLLNTFSTFNFTNAALVSLKMQERALIVNICSQASLKGYDESGAYTMSKHALLGYTRSLRKELMNSKIAVTAINLGQTYSTSWDEIDTDYDKLIDPEDVGKLIFSLSNLSSRSVVEEINLMPQGGEVNPV